VDLDFRRSREEVNRGHPERGETTIIEEPLPGERGYAVRQAGPKSSRFELVRLHGNDLLIVRVLREKPYDAQPGAEMARCERRARPDDLHTRYRAALRPAPVLRRCVRRMSTFAGPCTGY
jgi:hypothetical protein